MAEFPTADAALAEVTLAEAALTQARSAPMGAMEAGVSGLLMPPGPTPGPTHGPAPGLTQREPTLTPPRPLPGGSRIGPLQHRPDGLDPPVDAPPRASAPPGPAQEPRPPAPAPQPEPLARPAAPAPGPSGSDPVALVRLLTAHVERAVRREALLAQAVAPRPGPRFPGLVQVPLYGAPEEAPPLVEAAPALQAPPAPQAPAPPAVPHAPQQQWMPSWLSPLPEAPAAPVAAPAPPEAPDLLREHLARILRDDALRHGLDLKGE